MEINCTECGATAMKEEDFALFDYIYDFQNHRYKDVEFAGIIRMALCRDCFNMKYAERYKYTDSWGSIIAIGLLTIVVTIVAAFVIEGNAAGIIFLIGGGMTSWMIKSKIDDKKDHKIRKERYEDAKRNNFKDKSFSDFLLFMDTKNEIALVNGCDILQNKELATTIPQKKQGKRREYVPMKDYVKFYEANIATPIPEWIKVAYEKTIEK